METPWAFATAASEPREEARSRRMAAARVSSGVKGELGGEAITSTGKVRACNGRVKLIFGMCEDMWIGGASALQGDTPCNPREERSLCCVAFGDRGVRKGAGRRGKGVWGAFQGLRGPLRGRADPWQPSLARFAGAGGKRRRLWRRGVLKGCRWAAGFTGGVAAAAVGGLAPRPVSWRPALRAEEGRGVASGDGEAFKGCRWAAGFTGITRSGLVCACGDVLTLGDHRLPAPQRPHMTPPAARRPVRTPHPPPCHSPPCPPGRGRRERQKSGRRGGEARAPNLVQSDRPR